MKKRLLDYQTELFKDLQDQEESLAYLNAALADEDQGVFLLALKNVFEAQGCSIMKNKNIQSTHDEFMASLTPKEKQRYDEGYRELLLSEILLAIKKKDFVAARELAKLVGAL